MAHCGDIKNAVCTVHKMHCCYLPGLLQQQEEQGGKHVGTSTIASLHSGHTLSCYITQVLHHCRNNSEWVIHKNDCSNPQQLMTALSWVVHWVWEWLTFILACAGSVVLLLIWELQTLPRVRQETIANNLLSRTRGKLQFTIRNICLNECIGL